MRKFGMPLAVACLAMAGVACSAEGNGSNEAAQSSEPVTVADALRAGYARTPFGLVHPSCVHAVPDGAKVDRDGIHLRNGTVQPLGACHHARIATHASRSNASNAKTPATDGWTAASWAHGEWGYLQANFTVPQTPANQGDQLLYFFPSLEPEPGNAIIQPVLQWGTGYAGGGQYWSMASWSLYPSDSGDQTLYSTLTPVNSGDALVGTMQGNGSCSGGHCDSWTITTLDTTTGASTSLDTNPDPNPSTPLAFTWANGGVLEQYGVTSCDQYPPDGAITFSSVVAQDSNFSTVTPAWSNDVYSNISPQCNFSVSEPDSGTVTIAY